MTISKRNNTDVSGKSLASKTPQGLPAVDYGVGTKTELNGERGQFDKERPANYAQVNYSCSGALILKLTLSIIKSADVTMIHCRQD